MIRLSKIYLSILWLLPLQVFANVHYEAVRAETNGSFVRDQRGKCVRTSQEVVSDPCATHLTVDRYNKIAEMEERIIYFDFDKYSLKTAEKMKLDMLADAFREYNVTAVKIVGYTDRIGTDSYNLKLSEKRAEAVKSYLDSIVKLDRSVVTLRAFGKDNPVKICHEHRRDALIECLAPNRRVEIEVDKEVIEHESTDIEVEE